MKVVRGLSLLGVVAMTLALANGFINGDFFVDGGELFANPWGIVSLVDLYVGFSLFAIWMYVKESNKWMAVVWIVLLMVLGFFTGALYLLIKSLQATSMQELLLPTKKEA
jgi:uncharacterized protein YneF (UPF0154 family)